MLSEWENEISKSVNCPTLTPGHKLHILLFLTDCLLLTASRHIVPGSVKYHKYHGQGKVPAYQLVDVDIVLTTYQTLAGEYARGGSPLFTCQWFRVVLDEGDTLTLAQNNAEA